MTLSEQICQEINRKFYFDDFVLTNLFYTKDGVKMEICDGLIEFQDIYIILQIKERSSSYNEYNNYSKFIQRNYCLLLYLRLVMFWNIEKSIIALQVILISIFFRLKIMK